VLLTSIKLTGFKSFVDLTNFQVKGQLVGVVGPNGCGKSNIIDAVRWVLGESRASELRGESMQDVIFNGSTGRKPAGRASVELVFDNSLGKVSGQWGQYAEIAVRRVLARDGTSSYFINNQAVRRRDIQDIFMGTGLGPRAYAIIGQGMISRIIEARPDELRIFLEEAAGVSRYKERRRETENRLHDTRENLQRVEDIRRELETNLEKLEGQAEVARKYHALQTEQDEKQKLLWLIRRNEAEAERERVFREVEQAQNGLEAQTAELRRLEAALEQLRQAHFAAGDRMHQAQGHLYQTNSEIGSLEAQIRFVLESRSRMQAQINALAKQQDQWRQQGVRQQEELAEAGQRLDELGERAQQAQELLQQQSETLPTHEQAWREAQEKTGGLRTGIMQVQQQIELASTHHRNASGMLASLVTRRERLGRESSELQAPDAYQLAELSAQQEETRMMLQEEQLRIETLREQRAALEISRRAAQDALDAENAGLAKLEARLAALKQLQQNVQSQGKVQPWLDRHELGALPRLWQKLEIEPGWETALEAVLRERISALQVSNLDWAKAFLNDAPPAKLAFYTSASRDLAGTDATMAAPMTELTPLLSLLRLNDAGLDALLHDWLQCVFIVVDTATAFSLREKLPAGGCLVTREGHLVGKHSMQFYAPDSEQDGMMARRQEIEHLDRQQHVQRRQAEEARARLAQEDVALAQCGRQLKDAHQNADTLTKVAHETQIAVVKLSEMRQRFEQRSTQIQADLTEIREQEAAQQQDMSEAELRLEQLDVALAEAQERYEQCQTDFLLKEQTLNEARQKLRDCERAAQEAEFATKSQHNRIEELQRSITTAQQQAEKLLADMQQGQLELETLDDQAAQAGLQTLLNTRIDQERVLADARNELEQLSKQLRTAEEARLAAERGLQPQRDRIVELQLKEQAARLNQEQYTQQLAEAQADESALAQKLSAEMKAPSLQGEVTRLSNAIAALGAVNLAALDELVLASERKRFLDAQHADLSEAIGTLEDAIRRIDRETRELLQDTFDKVDRHFAELFPVLFGGGQAKLTMTGDEILDAGVQVMAQPPGKKNATIHLLSGGEKALTAIALVFAMFQLNPAPFCLLDEVDAPLDDANTERFCKMVKRMSANTQFLFISHNKIAMEMAQQLIGVTMQEQGVSRIVVVDLESAAEFASEVQAA